MFKEAFYRAQEPVIPRSKELGEEGKRWAWLSRDLLVKLKGKVLHLGRGDPQPVLILGVALTQVQGLAPGLVELCEAIHQNPYLSNLAARMLWGTASKPYRSPRR